MAVGTKALHGIKRAYFYFCDPPPPPPNPYTNDDIEQSPSQGGITFKGDLEQLNGDSVRSTAFPYVNEQMALVSSCIVGQTLGGMFSVH